MLKLMPKRIIKMPHTFHIGAAISGDARRGHGKAAGTCGAEGEAETVKEAHIAQKKQHHQYSGHGRIGCRRGS